MPPDDRAPRLTLAPDDAALVPCMKPEAALANDDDAFTSAAVVVAAAAAAAAAELAAAPPVFPCLPDRLPM
jgi:hypothetical protein